MKKTISVSSPIERTPRAMQLEGIFDVPPSKQSALSWEADLPIEEGRLRCARSRKQSLSLV